MLKKFSVAKSQAISKTYPLIFGEHLQTVNTWWQSWLVDLRRIARHFDQLL